jgi:signal transduction histidine kinase
MDELINILLVDDETRNLDALETILADDAYRLLRATDADKALRLLLENDVAAIVLDIKMPGVSGLELAQIIKGTKKFRQIPIVFLTAYLVDDRDIVTGYGAGAVDYLTKPVNPQILRLKVAVFADLFRKTRALAELADTLEARVQERTAELEKSEAALREAAEKKDLFLATLAHELRNPLAPLRTGVDVLMRQPALQVELARTLSAMNRQLQHMVRLIDDLLDVSRISRGKLEMRKESVDLANVIERALETAAPFLAARKQSVAFDAGAPVLAFVDATRIGQIVANLVHNACKHSPVETTVRVRLRCDGTKAVIVVTDEGVGIPADQLARVFDMFAKVERTGNEPTEGLGIGLALSRQLAELHGGTLTGESAGEGKGAIFTLSVPAGHADASPASQGSRDSIKSVPPDSRAPRLKVVVVEDNYDSADTIALWLEQLGHRVDVARTGPEGVALILKVRPDLVLCDIGLPGMDGVEVCQRVVQEMPVAPTMIALTGWGMESDRSRTVAAGFHQHLVKPVDPDKLRRMLDAMAARRASPHPSSP